MKREQKRIDKAGHKYRPKSRKSTGKRAYASKIKKEKHTERETVKEMRKNFKMTSGERILFLHKWNEPRKTIPTGDDGKIAVCMICRHEMFIYNYHIAYCGFPKEKALKMIPKDRLRSDLTS